MCVQYLRGSGSLYPVRLKVLGLFVVCLYVCVHYTLSLPMRALPPAHCCVEHSSHYSVCLRSTALTIQCILGLQPDMCNSQLSHIACFDPRLCDVVPCNINCPCWNAEESPQVAHTCFSVRVLHSSRPAYSLEVCVRLEYLTDPGRECARRETPPQGSGDCLPGMTS